MDTMNKRLLVLFLVLSVGFSSVWVMPREGERRLSCLSPNLPEKIEFWTGVKGAPDPKELGTLASDTEFSRMNYYHVTKPSVEMSVVFSGRDINNSIHRPERCLKAQGWNFIKERTVTVENVLADGSDVKFREIICKKPSINQKTKQPILLADGKQRHDYHIQYYTFFGHSDIVEGHYARTFIDIRDRLIGGYDQQWAYATFSASVMGEYAKQGIGMDDYLATYGMEETEGLLEDFIRLILPQVVQVPEGS